MQRSLEAEISGPKLSPTDAALLTAAAAQALRDQNWEGAELAAKASLANNRRSFQSWAILGVSLAKQKYFRMAAESFHHALRIKPNDLTTWVALGESCISLLDYENAVVALRRAIELDPNAAHPAGRRARAIVGRTMAKLSQG